MSIVLKLDIPEGAFSALRKEPSDTFTLFTIIETVI